MVLKCKERSSNFMKYAKKTPLGNMKNFKK